MKFRTICSHLLKSFHITRWTMQPWEMSSREMSRILSAIAHCQQFNISTEMQFYQCLTFLQITQHQWKLHLNPSQIFLTVSQPQSVKQLTTHAWTHCELILPSWDHSLEMHQTKSMVVSEQRSLPIAHQSISLPTCISLLLVNWLQSLMIFSLVPRRREIEPFVQFGWVQFCVHRQQKRTADHVLQCKIIFKKNDDSM